MAENPLAADLDHVLDHTRDLWEQLRGERIFITGGTGFFGCWLLESFAWANDRLGLKAEALVLTRNPDAFRRKAPHLTAHPAIHFHPGDVRAFEFPQGSFSHLIHAATVPPSSPGTGGHINQFEANIQGTRRVLEFVRSCGIGRMLFTSSGAVYGKQPGDMPNLSEDNTGGPDSMQPETAYGQSKRVSEYLCATDAEQFGLKVLIARGFAFVGPYLPLDANYAIGNFIRDAMRGGPIAIQGDGTPYRSYLYTADLAIWLWTILFLGKSRHPYNVGSDVAVNIQELAQIVQELIAPDAPIRIARKPVAGDPVQRYVPSIERCKSELGLQVFIPLADAIRRTATWHAQIPR